MTIQLVSKIHRIHFKYIEGMIFLMAIKSSFLITLLSYFIRNIGRFLVNKQINASRTKSIIHVPVTLTFRSLD